MKFRPCIDLHLGQVKQIVGSTLTDAADGTQKNDTNSSDTTKPLATNFETDRPSSSYAELYKRDGLTGGHVIMLGPGNDDAVSLWYNTNRLVLRFMSFCSMVMR